MPRYIDADALIFKLKTQDYSGAPDTLEDWTPEDMTNAEIAEIENAPTADVVEVVRCKDCKHSDYWYKDKRRCFLWHEAGIDVFEDGFCSYGERREDD